MTFVAVAPGLDRAHLTLRSAQLSPRVLRTDATGARVALVATSALLLAGDHPVIELSVGAGCWLEVVDTAGTVAFDGRGGRASWTVRIRVAEGGALLWNCEPFVVARGADVRRSTTVDLAAGAVVLLRETVVLGRSGETGGALAVTTRVDHAGRPLLAEDLDLTDPEHRSRPGVLGRHTVLDTVSLLGMRGSSPAPGPARCFALSGPGSVSRYLGRELHRSSLAAVYSDWRRELTDQLNRDVTGRTDSAPSVTDSHQLVDADSASAVR